MTISLLNRIYKYKLIKPNYELNPNLDQPNKKLEIEQMTNIKANYLNG